MRLGNEFSVCFLYAHSLRLWGWRITFYSSTSSSSLVDLLRQSIYIMPKSEYRGEDGAVKERNCRIVFKRHTLANWNANLRDKVHTRQRRVRRVNGALTVSISDCLLHVLWWLPNSLCLISHFLPWLVRFTRQRRGVFFPALSLNVNQSWKKDWMTLLLTSLCLYKSLVCLIEMAFCRRVCTEPN